MHLTLHDTTGMGMFHAFQEITKNEQKHTFFKFVSPIFIADGRIVHKVTIKAWDAISARVNEQGHGVTILVRPILPFP